VTALLTQKGKDAAHPVVAIPARDEEASIDACLRALACQTTPPAAVVLLLNNCTDRTEDIAKAIAFPFPLDIRSVHLQAHEANAGTARRLAMDRAAFLAGPRGVIMTTDADAIVPLDWVARNMAVLAAGADAVCGRAVIDPKEAAAIPAHLHEDDALECEYAGLLDAMTDALCPDMADPLPRHTEASGASIALTVTAFRQAGGGPRVATGEDRALIAALKRIDARIRHDPNIHVVVSGRTVGRAAGGMADTIRRRMIAQDVYTDSALEPPGDAVRRADFRRRLRQVWASGDPDADLAVDLQISATTLDVCLSEKFFGCAWDQVERLSPMLPRRRVRFADLPAQIQLARELHSLLKIQTMHRLILFPADGPKP
jgi:hypothetical protein